MAKIDDCLRKLRDAGATLDSKDERQVRDWVDQGIDPMAAVRRLYIERSKNVIDILGRARSQGAPISAYKDVYTEIVSKRSEMLERTFSSYQSEHLALGEKLDAAAKEVSDLGEMQLMLESMAAAVGVTNSQEGTRAPQFLLANATDDELLRVFDIMRFQDRVRIRDGVTPTAKILGIEGSSPEAMLASFKGKMNALRDAHERVMSARREISHLERRVQTIFNGENRNPSFGPIDSEGNYTIDPGSPDGLAEQVVFLYRAYRGQHGEPDENVIQTRAPTIAFAKDPETASLYAMDPNDRADTAVAPRVIVADLEMKKPWKPSRDEGLPADTAEDPFIDLAAIIEVGGVELVQELMKDPDIVSSISNTQAFEDFINNDVPVSYEGGPYLRDIVEALPQEAWEGLYGEGFRFLANPDLVEALKKAGYDGVIIGGTGDNALMTEYHVFSPDQVKMAGRVFEQSGTYAGPGPWVISSSKDAVGDLYIRRHGKNAGQVFRERQSENDLAISVNKDVLLPDYMYYTLQFLQPRIAAMARGTAQQYIRKGDVETALIEHFQNRVREDQAPPKKKRARGKKDAFSDQSVTAERREREAKMNYRTTVRLVEERSFAIGLTHVKSAEDAAHVVAPIRRNAQEGMWGVVLDENDKVLGIIEHSKGDISGSQVAPSILAGHIMQVPGARKVWFAHNHPSGLVEPSQADTAITRKMEDLMRGSSVEIQGHVIVGAGRDRFALMGPTADIIATDRQVRAMPRNKRVPIYIRRYTGRPAAGNALTSPELAEDEIKSIGLKDGVLLLDNRNRVLGVLEMTGDEMAQLRNTGQLDRLLRAAADVNAAALISVTSSRNEDASSNMAALANVASSLRHLDHVYFDSATGRYVSMAAMISMSRGRSTFNQDLVGMTSGLLEAAKAMPQEKGPAKQMIAILKKQPGVKKEEMDWLELEDWIQAKGYVTKDEIIDFVDKNGVVVEEFHMAEVDNQLSSAGIDIRAVNPAQLRLSWQPSQVPVEAGLDYLENHPTYQRVVRRSLAADEIRGNEMNVVSDVFTATVAGRHFAVISEESRPDVTDVDSLMEAIETPGITVLDLDNQEELVSPLDQKGVDSMTLAWLFVKAKALREAEAAGGPRDSDVAVWDIRGVPRYTTSTLDGGMNHREIVFRLKPPVMPDRTTITGEIVLPPPDPEGSDGERGVREMMGDLLKDLADIRTLGGNQFGRVTEQVIELNELTQEQWNRVDALLDDARYLAVGVQLHELGRKGKDAAPLYTRHHAYTEWDNVLMWARVNERTGANGERILFIEEIQSDWHQTGRKSGYRRYDPAFAQAEREVIELRREMESYAAATDFTMMKISRAMDDLGNEERPNETADEAEDRRRKVRLWGGDSEEIRGKILRNGEWLAGYEWALGDEWVRNNLTQGEINDIHDFRTAHQRYTFNAVRIESARLDRQEDQVPDAPFKGNAWAELAIKRVIRMAAEQGFEQVAWTTGEQQAERYNLAQATDYVAWNPLTQMLEARNFSEAVPRERLEEYVGAEIAGKLIEKGDRALDFDIVANESAPGGFIAVDTYGDVMYDEHGDELQGPNEEDLRDVVFGAIASGFEARVSGDDLQVGGQGMKNFYDKVMVNLTNKAMRKFDKSVRVRPFQGQISGADQSDIARAKARIADAERVLRRLDAEGGRFPDSEATTRARYEAILDGAVSHLRMLEDEVYQVHVVDVSPKVRDGAMKGQTLFQSRRRGAITFDEQNRAVIRMTRARDMSTFLHESGHLYLELLADMALMPGASDQVKGDFDKVLQFLGVEDRSQIQRVHHEKFARAFEAYAREGKAPDPSLREVFIAFGSWLRRIYAQLRQLDVELTPEIRGVFDRMIATDTAIREAEAVQNYVELFASAEDMGVSPEVFDVYRRRAAEAHDEASMREQRKMLAAQLRETQAWYKDERAKMEAEVRAEAEAMPVYIALARLQNGKNPDGSTPGTATFKLSKKSLLRLLSGSQETLNRLPGRGKRSVYAREGGVDAELAAREFGFQNASEMIAQMLRSVPMETYIRQETEARMAQTFPDPMVSGELQEGAMEAVHSDKRAQVMAAEMRAIRKKMEEDKPIVEAHRRAERREQAEAKEILPKRDELALIKESAKRLIARMRVRDVKPHTYLATERREGRAAFEALGRKDYQAAYEHKRRQIVNHEMYRAAIAAMEAAEKHRTYLARFDKKALRQRMGKGGVLDRIDEVLSTFNFRKLSLSKVDQEKAQKELRDAIEDGTILAPESLVQKLADRGQNYQDLTVEELKGLRDIVAQLEAMGRAQYQAVVNGEKKNIQDAAGSLAADLREKQNPIPLLVGTERLGAATKRTLKSALWNVLRPGAIARILDDANYGTFTETLIEPIRRAYTERMLPWFEKMDEALAKIYQKHYDDAELRALNNERVWIESLNQSLTRADMLAMALNWGNEGNRAALLGGKHPDTGELIYSRAAVREVLAKLTAKDWAFVQDMWDYIGSYYHDEKDAQGNVIREGIATVEKRRRGVAPERVEPAPFTIRTADGVEIEVRGGYYPLTYDHRYSKKQRMQEADDAMDKMARGGFVRAQTRAGSTHERVQNHGKVVLLRLGLIDRHLREVIRDIAIGDEVNFVKRVLDESELDIAMQETGNGDALVQLNRWLADAAVGELPNNGVPDQVFAYVRTGFTKAKLGWNLVTMMLQVTGFAQTAAVIGSGTMMRGVGKYMQSPVDNWKFIMEASAFMRQRYVSQSWNKDVMDTRAHLQAFPLLGIGPTRSRRITKAFARTLFAPIMAMQSQVDAITWMSVYMENMNIDQDQARAVHRADAAVEMAQTSGFFGDRSAIERGTISDKTVQSQFVRIWTTLISYMMAKAGIAVEKGFTLRQSYRRDGFTFKESVKFAMDMLMLFTVEGVLAAVVYGNVPDWDEDEDTVIGWTAKQTALSLVSGVPFVRETLSMQYGGGNTPIGGLARDAVNFYIQASQGEIDEALLKSLNNVGGTLFHYPSSQTNRMIDTAWSEFAEGEDRPATDYLTGPRGND